MKPLRTRGFLFWGSLTLFLLLLIAVAVVLWAMKAGGNGSLTKQTVSSGRLDVYPDFQTALVSQREVAVWTPDNYQVGDSVDVLYMHDGQQIFDSLTTWNHQEWCVDEVMGSLMANGKIRKTIVVAIANVGKDRYFDYFPRKVFNYLQAADLAEIDTASYNADRYLQFIVNEVKPFVDEKYRPLTSKEHTFIAGSSMGGLISLYALCEYPEVFGGAACLSTHQALILSAEFDKKKDLIERFAQAWRAYVKEKLPQPNTHFIYMDRGTVELDGVYAPYQALMDQQFREAGWDENHYQSLVFKGHKHMEIYWAERLHKPLEFLLGR